VLGGVGGQRVEGRRRRGGRERRGGGARDLGIAAETRQQRLERSSLKADGCDVLRHDAAASG